jgi:hypothetical protein
VDEVFAMSLERVRNSDYTLKQRVREKFFAKVLQREAK